jgi:hypothetical protein
MEDFHRYPYPTLYSDNVILGEYAGEQLQHCCFRSILELVGLYDLHEICLIESVAARKAATFAIEKFNRQHNTRLTYACVRDLTPTYAFSPGNDPIIYCNNMYMLKRVMCSAIVQNPVMDYNDVEFNAVNMLIRSMDLSSFEFVCVYYPTGFWVVYQSRFVDLRRVVLDSSFCMSSHKPIEGLSISAEREHSYSLPPEEEASLSMSDRIETNIFQNNLHNYERRAE